MKKKRRAEDHFETLSYPADWEAEYRRRGTVKKWRRARRTTKRLGRLGGFAQYALRYLLRRHRDIESVTWLFLASIDNQALARQAPHTPWTPRPKNKGFKRTKRNWAIMRKHVGEDNFDTLQKAIVKAGFTGITGEPDLFCYGADGTWFFAEAKSVRDRLGPHQKRWFRIANKVLGEKHQVRVYRVVPG
jgi:hypothetical protein